MRFTKVTEFQTVLRIGIFSMFFDLFISHCKAKKVLIRDITKNNTYYIISLSVGYQHARIDLLSALVEILERFLRCRRNSFLEMSMRFTRRHFVFNE